MIHNLRLLFLFVVTLCFIKTIPAQENIPELFDDFNYESASDNALPVTNKWSIVDGISGPPANAVYSANNIEFIIDTSIANNKLLKVSTVVDKNNGTISHARIETSDFSYRHGTFAARVYFDDTPALFSDANVETFYTISPYATCTEAEKYSECDFEYLPWDAWGGPSRSNNLYFTTWETCETKVYNNSLKSYRGWHTLLYTSTPGGPVQYYVDGQLMATHNKYIPDSDVNISFANWIFNNTTGTENENRKSSMLVDWVYHSKDISLNTNEVINRVEYLRENGILRKNTTGSTSSSNYMPNEKTHAGTGNIKIFPNPSSDVFNIEITGEPDYPGFFTLTSAEGKTVSIPTISSYSKGVCHLKISLQNLKPGIYFFHTWTGSKTTSNKLLVLKQ
ncbi:MAG: T9SS type A sorting domain-containing protein [Bacteroidales bacterium]|nr:T9SS type A sorting domain-containing protein [Bacteroidales bacterium]